MKKFDKDKLTKWQHSKDIGRLLQALRITTNALLEDDTHGKNDEFVNAITYEFLLEVIFKSGCMIKLLNENFEKQRIAAFKIDRRAMELKWKLDVAKGNLRYAEDSAYEAETERDIAMYEAENGTL